jgi:arabinosaccharide transport system substrate-binding protein
MTNERRRGRYQRSLEASFDMLSPGGWIICALAVVSTIVLVLWPIPQKEGLVFWIFAKTHQRLYEPMTAAWNAAQPPADRVHIVLLSAGALQRRLLSGFLSGTPVPDLVEAYVQIVAQAFKGPLEDVGFVDLTDIVQAEGIDEQINAPSCRGGGDRCRRH